MHTVVWMHTPSACLLSQPHPPRPVLPLPARAALQEQLDGDLLVFSPYPSLSKFLQDSGLTGSQHTCEAAWCGAAAAAPLGRPAGRLPASGCPLALVVDAVFI